MLIWESDNPIKKYQEQFRNLLKQHVERGYLRDPKIQQILEEIPLERILDQTQLQRFVLMDSPVLFYYRDQQNVRTISAPHMISMTLSMLELQKEDNVLIIGSKGGLIEAAIAKAVSQAYILEEHEEVAILTEETFIKLGMTNIWVHRGNPYLGLQENGPFSKILITGAVPFLSHQIINQLSVNGILVLPLMLNEPTQQAILQIVKTRNGLEIANYGGVIYASLYSKDVPPLNPRKDLTFHKIHEYGARKPKSTFTQRQSFGEEFRHLPKIEINQIIFPENNSISICRKSSDFKTENHDLPVLIPMTLRFIFFNQEKNQVRISTELQVSKIINEEYRQEILLKTEENYVDFFISIPLIEGIVHLDITALSLQRFRLAHNSGKLYLMQDGDDWNFSLEFIE